MKKIIEVIDRYVFRKGEKARRGQFVNTDNLKSDLNNKFLIAFLQKLGLPRPWPLALVSYASSGANKNL